MKRNRLASCIFVCWLGVLVGLSCPTFGVEYWAFSLQQAEKQIANNGNMIAVAKQLGGITDPLAIVFDEQTKDLVLVGRKDFQSPSLSIEDFIVALRAIMVHHQWPLVSIDKDENSYQTKRQKVRYEGGIEDTAFGNVLLQADVVLKKIGLGEINAQVWGVSSYFDLLCGEVKEKQTRGNIRATFWFVGASAHPSGFAAREGTMLLEDGQLVVRVAVRMGFQETHSPKPESGQDSAAAQFAEHLSNKYDDLAQQFPILQRLRTLYKMVALAAGIYDQKNRYSSFQPDLSFWLQKYSLTSTLTPREYPLVEKTRDVEIPGKTILVSLDGGVELRPLLLELEDGSISAFRDVVVKCRPNPSALVWRVPLEYWKSLDSMEGHFRDFDQKLRHLAQEYGDRLGTTLDAYIGGPRENFATPARQAAASLSPASFHHPIPKFNYNPSPNLAAARHIGGVMLSEVAQVEGTQRPEVQWAQGQFALVVEGQNAYIDPKLFRKFVTALWCVYYSDQDPGVSIDPIGPDIEKHLVRYIGRVVNTDLGRVMREADYVMKKWAVGTERPDYPGFQPVDGWMRHYGPAAIGISRRFWFVPEDIRFRRGGDLLLFDSGRMRLRTEYDVEGLRGQASPADQKFADFFTDHYQQLAQKYPIYKELFEYAQLVALAKYLKQNGVPLHWFLMAHKELVLTEDSPGTVDQLAKNSDYFQGMRIQGGVNLGTQAQYVLDREAVAALRKAWAQQASAGPAVSPDTQVVADAGMGRSAPSPSQPVSFAVHGKDYTVVPQGTATTGRDHRGLRYQTDLALRRQGKPALELVRYYNGRQQQVGHFGPGWDLLIPYRVAPANEKRRPFLNAIIPEQMVVENLLSGQKELLSFSTDR
ncbi:MAG: hypothetical protein RMI90_09555, partial [Thermoguttaceae bacterium]|nr:hypothetical protein [Thermoguttaceae bacterium]